MFGVYFHSYFLLFLGTLICISLLFLLLRSPKIENFAYLRDVQKVYGKGSVWYVLFAVLLSLTSLLFFVFLAHPYATSQKQTIKKEGVDIEVVFDLSYSMIAQDLKPSRIEVAKKVLGEFFKENVTDRIGLILFSGRPFTSIPLTFDSQFLAEYISQISVDYIDQSRVDMAGTAIGDALLLAAKNLEKEKKDTTKDQIIILITDGEANKGIDPLLALKYLKEKHIKTYTIGVGKDAVTSIVVPSTFTGVPQKLQV